MGGGGRSGLRCGGCFGCVLGYLVDRGSESRGHCVLVGIEGEVRFLASGEEGLAVLIVICWCLGAVVA